MGDGREVVVYDGSGLFSAARVWWIFRLMGKTDVAVLDGGFPKWQAEGREIEDMPPVVRDRHMTVSRQDPSGEGRDPRSPMRPSWARPRSWTPAPPPVSGVRAPEPRAGLRSGRIPGSRNIPFAGVLNPDGTMKPPAALRAVFEAAGVDLKKPRDHLLRLGRRQAVLSLALERVGHRNHALYDGSWAESGMYDDLRVAAGP